MPTRDILHLAQSAGITAIVGEAAAGIAKVRSLSWDDVGMAATLSSAWQLLVVDLAPELLAEALVVARLARARKPKAAIVGLASISRDGCSLLPHEDALALTDVVYMDAEELGILRAHFLDPSWSGAFAAALRCVYRSVPLSHHAAATAVFEDLLNSKLLSLAKRLGLSRFALDRELRRDLGIAAGRFSLWCRAILATSLLEHSKWAVEQGAKATSFGGARALRRSLRKLVGKRPRALRRRGSTEDTGRAFASELATLKTASIAGQA